MERERFAYVRPTSHRPAGESDAAAASARGWTENWKRALSALEQLDIEQVHKEASEMVEAIPNDPQSRERAVPVLYELLRSIEDRLAPGYTTDSTDDRLRLVGRLSAARDVPSLRITFASELRRLVEPVSRRPKVNAIVLRARKFIEEHSTERVSLSRVARELNVAPNYLSTLFRRECGLTLTEYIHSIRIDHAERLMRRGERPLSRVAGLVGYQNYRHFYRSFVKVRQVCPADHLKRIGPRYPQAAVE